VRQDISVLQAPSGRTGRNGSTLRIDCLRTKPSSPRERCR
jgi:hypothetical protein